MRKILFFSRGRGHGHAIPDMAIAEALHAREPRLNICFVSYATGAATFRAAGREVIDLQLPETNGYVENLLACEAVVRRERPDLVVGHEEFAALVAARIVGVPSVFVSAWLPTPGSHLSESIGLARGVIVIESAGVFPIAPEIRVKPQFIGPIVRPMKFTVRDRATLRGELGWSEEETVLLVVPGGSAREVTSPIGDLVVSAFLMLKSVKKRLVWLASSEYEDLTRKFQGIAGVEIRKFSSPVERLLGAGDVVITKGTRGISHDAAAVGIPSISISHGRNPVDDLLVPRIANNKALVAAALNPEILAQFIAEACSGGPRKPAEASYSAIARAADSILDHLAAGMTSA